jgi:DNA-binding protein H-NS
MDSYQSLLGKISALQKRASSLRDNEKKRVIAEMRKLIALYDVQPFELFSDAKPSAVGKRSKRILFPKYQDPATGKTWNGHGKRPFWLVGDKEAYLIDRQADAGDTAARPKRKTPTKKSRKSSVDKVIADVTKTRKGRSPKRQTSGTVDSPPETGNIPAPLASPPEV